MTDTRDATLRLLDEAIGDVDRLIETLLQLGRDGEELLDDADRLSDAIFEAYRAAGGE